MTGRAMIAPALDAAQSPESRIYCQRTHPVFRRNSGRTEASTGRLGGVLRTSPQSRRKLASGRLNERFVNRVRSVLRRIDAIGMPIALRNDRDHVYRVEMSGLLRKVELASAGLGSESDRSEYERTER